MSWRPPSRSLPLRPLALRAPYQAAMARSLLSPQPPQPRTLSAALLTALQRCMLHVGAQGSGAESPAPHFPVSHVRRPPVEQGRGPRWNTRTWLPPRVLAPSPCLRICGKNQTKQKVRKCSGKGFRTCCFHALYEKRIYVAPSFWVVHGLVHHSQPFAHCLSIWREENVPCPVRHRTHQRGATPKIGI